MEGGARAMCARYRGRLRRLRQRGDDSGTEGGPHRKAGRGPAVHHDVAEVERLREHERASWSRPRSPDRGSPNHPEDPLPERWPQRPPMATLLSFGAVGRGRAGHSFKSVRGRGELGGSRRPRAFAAETRPSAATADARRRRPRRVARTRATRARDHSAFTAARQPPSTSPLTTAHLPDRAGAGAVVIRPEDMPRERPLCRGEWRDRGMYACHPPDHMAVRAHRRSEAGFAPHAPSEAPVQLRRGQHQRDRRTARRNPHEPDRFNARAARTHVVTAAHARATRRRRMAMLGLLSLLVFAAGAVVAYARGGTAKPPTKGVVAANPVPTLPDPAFSVAPALIHGFDETGFTQDATISADNSACPDVADAKYWGGAVTINNTKITVPCNVVVQMPANPLTWADMVNGGPSLSLKDSAYPSFEMRAVGNIVDGKHMAGLMFASQQSTNTGSGIVSKIDYSTGRIHVDTGDPANPAVIEFNDPNGRFGRKQSPDARFSVDDQNPTIHAGTGYPLCVPRTDPATADDALCPQANRPKPAGAGRHCRNFTDAGVVPLPASGELTQPPAGQVYCSMFVMPSAAS